MEDDAREMVKTSLYVPSSLLERARAVAQEQDRTLTQVLRRAIEVGIDAETREQVPA